MRSAGEAAHLVREAAASLVAQQVKDRALQAEPSQVEVTAPGPLMLRRLTESEKRANGLEAKLKSQLETCALSEYRRSVEYAEAASRLGRV